MSSVAKWGIIKGRDYIPQNQEFDNDKGCRFYNLSCPLTGSKLRAPVRYFLSPAIQVKPKTQVQILIEELAERILTHKIKQRLLNESKTCDNNMIELAKLIDNCLEQEYIKWRG